VLFRSTIIIGSGISGLASAAALSMTGDRVLVLEKHFQVGGYTHVFRRKNYEWDVGVHYLGTIHPESSWYLSLLALTEGRIRFADMPDPVDNIMFPGTKISMPNTYEGYKEELGTYFPKEKQGISDYLDLIKGMRQRLTHFFMMNLLPKPMTKFAQSTFIRSTYKLATSTTEEIMNHYLKDEHLKQILDAQWGNIGMPRFRCSFLIHAAMLGYYLESGACYPVGGSSVFARELSRTIHKYGSAIRIKAEVQKILVQNNKAIGVRLANGEEIYAKQIVSTVGLFRTYGDLVNSETPKFKQVQEEVAHLPAAYEYINLFLGFPHSLEKYGIKSENYWIYREFGMQLEDLFWDLSRPLEEEPPFFFLSSSSMRDPAHGENGADGYAAQIVLVGKQGFFKPWEHTQWRKREDEYYKIKDEMSQGLINTLDRYFPGMKQDVDYLEAATPLSYYTFCNSPGGVPYGIASTPHRYKSLVCRPTTPIKNLYLAGQDLILPGVSAAFRSIGLTLSLIKRRHMVAYLTKMGRQYL
jgi:all-trans-retinol 13,14-reductase